jgi:two-component system response regulator AtoC
MLERAMVLADGDLITEADLPEHVNGSGDPVALTLQSGELSIKRTTRVIEEALIRRALDRTQGNRTQAAKLLEISHRALLYKLKEFGIA